jgi:hypothetical protein
MPHCLACVGASCAERATPELKLQLEGYHDIRDVSCAITRIQATESTTSAETKIKLVR